MPIQRVALIFDDTVRPDTTGIYCKKALSALVQAEHFRAADLDKMPRKGFDLYLSIDDGLDYQLPEGLHPFAGWLIDTHMNFEWCLQRARHFDFVFTAQRDGAEAFRKRGLTNVQHLPLACDPDMHKKHDLPKEYELCFVGNMFPGPRLELVRLLQEHFVPMFIGREFFETMAQVYSKSRLVFNRSIKNDVNMRVFEAVACGSLLLTNDLRDNGQDQLFRDGIHLATYRDA